MHSLSLEDLRESCSRKRMQLSGDLQFQVRTVTQTNTLADQAMICALRLELEILGKEN